MEMEFGHRLLDFLPVFSLFPLPLTALLSKSCEMQSKLIESMSYHAFYIYSDIHKSFWHCYNPLLPCLSTAMLFLAHPCNLLRVLETHSAQSL